MSPSAQEPMVPSVALGPMAHETMGPWAHVGNGGGRRPSLGPLGPRVALAPPPPSCPPPPMGTLSSSALGVLRIPIINARPHA